MGLADGPWAAWTGSDGMAEALIAIRADSGEISDCNEAAAHLLGVPAAALRGVHWQRAIGDSGSNAALLHAFAARRRALLPPFILRHASGSEVIVGGLLLPYMELAAAEIGMLLWPLLEQSQAGLPEALAVSDTLAVLGADQLPYGEHWQVADTAALMADIRASLLEIVRGGDTVGPPVASSVVFTLRDVDIEGARDICRALLSHVHHMHTPPGTAAADVRLCVGLAQRLEDGSALATLLAANGALLRAQRAGTEPILAAADGDQARTAGALLHYAGILSEPFTAGAPGSEAASTVHRPGAEKSLPPVAPIEKGIEGYVVDNMEGAVDQAIFLARLDVPVAIIGPAGTGKMYVARVIHEETGASADMFEVIDCRELRGRGAAHARIARALARGEGRTLVFKSPHLLHGEVQLKLARQISSRRLADVSPPRYLPRMKLVALFPEKLEVLIRRAELAVPLASAFAGYPITVPPIRDRKQAVLRWAHKILGQEGERRDREMKGFTPDAERAMLRYEWPGNISEMRQCIHDAIDKTDKDWLTPVDLGLFAGISADGAIDPPEPLPFLVAADRDEVEAGEGDYAPSAQEALYVALGEAVHSLLALNMIKPLGTWVEDELVLAALDRYRGDLRRAGDFLHTRPRNIARWLPKIESREEERNGSALWQKSRRLLREWVRETSPPDQSPLSLMADALMAHVNEQGRALGSATRARIMGVSTPTYLKRCREAATR